MFELDFVIDLLLFGKYFRENRGWVHREDLDHSLAPKTDYSVDFLVSYAVV